jgi:hypothetical protein
MIPISLFNVLVAVMVLLVLYSFIDYRNRFYGNIVTAFLSSILATYLSVMISIGVVQYDPATAGNGVLIVDASIGYILLAFGVTMMIYFLVMIYDVYDERRMAKEAEP